MIFLDKPKSHVSLVHVAACFLENSGSFLFLKRSSHEESPGTWCVPGGKLKKGERPIDGARRELFEETQIQVKELNFIHTVFIESCAEKAVGFDMHIFYAPVDAQLAPTLNSEHTDFKWMGAEEAKAFPLISGDPTHLDVYMELIHSSLSDRDIPSV